MPRKPQIEVIDNRRKKLADVLNSELGPADEFLAASAFLNSPGLEKIKSKLSQILDNGGYVAIVHGIDFQITDPGVIKTLVDLSEGNNNIDYKVYFDQSQPFGQEFHTKLYIISSDCAVIGSSNLTSGGLSDNIEVNVVMRNKTQVKKCRHTFEWMFNSNKTLIPNDEFVDRFKSLWNRFSRLSSTKKWASDVKALINDFRQPKYQYHFAAEATLSLQNENEDKYVSANKICERAEIIAKKWGYRPRTDWKVFPRGILNRWGENSDGMERNLFESKEGQGGQGGKYRLTDNGRDLALGSGE